MKKQTIVLVITLIFYKSAAAQITGNVSEYFYKNLDELKLSNVNHVLYNLKREVVEICDWSYQLDEKGIQYNKKHERCFGFNENHEVEKRTYINSNTGKSNEIKYLNFKEDIPESVNEYDKNGNLSREKIILYNGSVKVGHKERYRNNMEFDIYEYESRLIKDSILIGAAGQLNYYLNDTLVKRISGTNYFEYKYHGNGNLEAVNTYRRGNLISKDSFDLNGRLILRITSKFDKEDNIDQGEIEQFNYDQGQIKSIRKLTRRGNEELVKNTEFRYDNKNILIAIVISFESNPSINYSVGFNNKGDIVNVSTLDQSFKYKNYKYDRKGNWIYRERIKNSLIRYEERNIVYRKKF